MMKMLKNKSMLLLATAALVGFMQGADAWGVRINPHPWSLHHSYHDDLDHVDHALWDPWYAHGSSLIDTFDDAFDDFDSLFHEPFFHLKWQPRHQCGHTRNEQSDAKSSNEGDPARRDIPEKSTDRVHTDAHGRRQNSDGNQPAATSGGCKMHHQGAPATVQNRRQSIVDTERMIQQKKEEIRALEEQMAQEERQSRLEEENRQRRKEFEDFRRENMQRQHNIREHDQRRHDGELRDDHLDEGQIRPDNSHRYQGHHHGNVNDHHDHRDSSGNHHQNTRGDTRYTSNMDSMKRRHEPNLRPTSNTNSPGRHQEKNHHGFRGQDDRNSNSHQHQQHQSHGHQSHDYGTKHHMRGTEINIVTMEIPGYYPNDVSIQTAGNRIQVHGSQACSCEDSCVAREFERSFKLPNNVDSRTLKAHIDTDGQLVISGERFNSVVSPSNVRVRVDGLGVPLRRPRVDCKHSKPTIRTIKIDKRTGKQYVPEHYDEEPASYHEPSMDDDVTIETVQG